MLISLGHDGPTRRTYHDFGSAAELADVRFFVGGAVLESGTRMPISALVPDPNVLLALEPAELGAVLLEYLNAKPPHENLGKVGLHLCTGGDNLAAYGQLRDEVKLRLAEGWAWLKTEGLIVPHPDDTYGMWSFITRKGRALRTRVHIAAYQRAAAFPTRMLHPVIAAKSEPPFMRGEYPTAVFQAFKEVEVAVRTAGGFPQKDHGTELMRAAFHETTGPLTDLHSPLPERQSLAHLFAGAIGSYKNPHSHRNVDIEAKEAIEMVMLASHLMSIVDGRKVHAQPRRRSRRKRTAPSRPSAR